MLHNLIIQVCSLMGLSYQDMKHILHCAPREATKHYTRQVKTYQAIIASYK